MRLCPSRKRGHGRVKAVEKRIRNTPGNHEMGKNYGKRYILEYGNANLRAPGDHMKSSLKTLGLGFDEAGGEGRADSR